MENVVAPAQQHVLAQKLTRYERIQVIGMRAEQLARGAQAFVDATGTVGPYELAERELESQRLPMIVVRNLPDGKPQYLRLSGGGPAPPLPSSGIAPAGVVPGTPERVNA